MVGRGAAWSRSLLAMGAIEILRIIHFDRRRRVLGIAEYRGDAERVVMPMREIIGEALRLGSAGLLLFERPSLPA